MGRFGTSWENSRVKSILRQGLMHRSNHVTPACLSDHLIGGREKRGRGCKVRIYSSDNILTLHYSHAVDALFSCNRKSAGNPQGLTMPSFLDDRVDSDAILEDIRSIVEIESPSRSAPGVNRVLETIARLFEGTGAAWERELTTDSFGDILLVRCDPTRNEPGILVLSHMDTVHPVGTLTGKLTYRREGDRVYGPGIYDMKGGLMLGVAAFRRIALARRRTKLPITFLFTPDEELSSPVSRSVIEREARGQRYVLVTEPSREGGKVVTERKGV